MNTLWDFPQTPRPFDLFKLPIKVPPTVVVLAPHPDDFDAIALTLRHFHLAGAIIHVAVLTTGASGVEQGFDGANDDEQKRVLREAEQRASCALFGLTPERLSFLRLPSDENGELSVDDANRVVIRDYLAARRPHMVFMPHGNDSNTTHRHTYALFRSVVLAEGWSMWALLNQDAKTLAIRTDLYTPFGDDSAAWKGDLLRLHRSQQQRNLNTRGKGFDDRVLEINRRAGSTVGAPYAEIFELERFG